MVRPLPIFVMFSLLLGAPAQENSGRRLTTGALTQSDFRVLLSQAESGDREAQYRLAELYAHPEDSSVAQNDTASRKWMLRSAEQGYAPAELEMGRMYVSTRGEEEIWLRRAAEQGNADAQFWLGNAYEDDRFGAPNYQKAFKWLQRAAEQGQPDAQVILGEMYEDGDFVSQNYALAAKWYRQVAEQILDSGGPGVARNHLGRLYMDGLGVPKNLVLAYMWFALSEPDASLNGSLKDVQSDMTRSQVAHARKMRLDWLKRHAPPKTLGGQTTH